MGIPSFYRWLRDKGYKAILRRNVPIYVSSLLMDFNGILHQTAQLVYAYGEHDNKERQKLIKMADPHMLEAEYYNALSAKLHDILTSVQPKDTLVIAVDGVAPRAKMNQQVL